VAVNETRQFLLVRGSATSPDEFKDYLKLLEDQEEKENNQSGKKGLVSAVS